MLKYSKPLYNLDYHFYKCMLKLSNKVEKGKTLKICTNDKTLSSNIEIKTKNKQEKDKKISNIRFLPP